MQDRGLLGPLFMKKKVDPLNKLAEEAFWSEFHELDLPEERYVVVDRRTGEVVVNGARLNKHKRRTKV